MNEIGGKSNSGEGGEEPRRFVDNSDGSSSNSRIKQIASGRFGVDLNYLQSAEEIEIKMAQGAKPGEGGQLPGFKVNELIAKLRNTAPGVTLISPPPHHDIYSIEDLAQLIFDLKMVNRKARICVKLVAKSGVGGIAVGVAKALADVVLISGHEGGTGASPLTSIKHAGLPWELGVAETHQSLVQSGLRDKVILRADGGIRTGMDVLKAAILGAEEFNFGTMALIALGCVYVKKCHLNNCPVGIATQDPNYRSKFKGTPENLIRYLNAVATECRQELANLGFDSLDSIIGRTDLYSISEIAIEQNLDLQSIASRSFVQELSTSAKYDSPPVELCSFDDSILTEIRCGQPTTVRRNVVNTDRNIGTRLASELNLGNSKAGPVKLILHGSAGQSLGAFICPGIQIHLTGETNDYVGKGMSGGEIVIRPFDQLERSSPVIAGNAILYGATDGRFLAAGRVAERFCVRNSGATAIVEGCGDHGCEYMTRGTSIVLGEIGRNFGAGMTGGEAYVFDPNGEAVKQCNLETVECITLDDRMIETLKEHIVEFAELTGSTLAAKFISDWNAVSRQFTGVFPRS